MITYTMYNSLIEIVHNVLINNIFRPFRKVDKINQCKLLYFYVYKIVFLL